MLSRKIVRMLKPNIMMNLPKKYHSQIDQLLNEAYIVKNDNGVDLICIPSPNSSYLCLQFSSLNGAYYDIDFWDLVKQNGFKI